MGYVYSFFMNILRSLIIHITDEMALDNTAPTRARKGQRDNALLNIAAYIDLDGTGRHCQGSQMRCIAACVISRMAWHSARRLSWKRFLPATAASSVSNVKRVLVPSAKQMRAIYARCAIYDETSFTCPGLPEADVTPYQPHFTKELYHNLRVIAGEYPVIGKVTLRENTLACVLHNIDDV